MRAFAKAASAGPSKNENGGTFSFGVLAAMLVCAAAFLGIGAPAASAAPEAQPAFSYLTSFGNPQGNQSVFGDTQRNGLAVDSHGNILFATLSNVLIYAPDSAAGGNFLGEISTPPGFNPFDVAVDPGNDALYVEDNGAFFATPTVIRYLSDGQPNPTYTLDPTFEVPGGSGVFYFMGNGSGITVDPATHDLLLADPGAGAIQRYDSSGALVSSTPTPGMSPEWVAVATDGSLLVAQRGNPNALHLSAGGSLLNEFSVGEVGGLAVDPTTGAVVFKVEVGEEGLLRSYSLAGTLLSESQVPAAARESLGIAVASNDGRLYDARQASASPISAFVPATYPGVEDTAVSNVGPHSAHFSAEVEPGTDPGGSPGDPAAAGSAAHFEYSVDGGKTWSSTPDQPLSDAGLTTVEANVTGLLVNSDYLVRLEASNSLISHTSEPVAFSTPETAPEVETGSASDVTETSAGLNGTINPAGRQTTYYFEYGTTPAYGSRIPVSIDATAGDGRVPRLFGRTVFGLEPGTTYHFRLVAENSLGVTEGADRTFTTVVAGAAPRRSYEQVTPIDKKGRPLDVFAGDIAKADGSEFAWISKAGESGGAYQSFAISERDDVDWTARGDLSVPFKTWGGAIVATTTLAISPDFTHALLASNRALTPGANEDGINLYRMDIATHQMTLVATYPGLGLGLAFELFTGIAQSDKFIGSAPDLSWMVFRSPVPFLPEAPSEALYRWSEEDGLEVASVLPSGESSPVLEPHSIAITPVRRVSADGSRVYFESGANGAVYMRENGEKTTLVSHTEGDPSTPQTARLKGISKDGRYAFIASVQPLTADAPPYNPEDANAYVYRYDLDQDSLQSLGAPDCETAGGSGVWATSLGVTDDGNTAYWSNCNTLNVWRNGELSSFGSSTLGSGEGVHSMSPNGRYFAFERGATNSGRDGDVFLYDADAKQLSCASCHADGSPGNGYLPYFGIESSYYRPRAVTNDGQVFFTSYDDLVARDVNGTRDVYLYQDGNPSLISPGKGNFGAQYIDMSEDGSNVFFATDQKLVGQDNDQTTDIYDARINGGLPSQNPPPPQECLRDDCKATPNAGPELPFGGSEALSGPGNVTLPKHKKCGKGKRAKKVKGKVRCVKKQKANKNKKGGNR